MNQNIWGPPTWFFLHTLSLNYPLNPTEEQRNRMKKFLLSLQYILPCRYCRDNYKRHLKELPAKLENRESFFKFLVDLHNFVNSETGKRMLTYKEVLDLYQTAYQKEFTLNESELIEVPKNDYRLIILIIITVVLLFFVMYGY